MRFDYVPVDKIATVWPRIRDVLEPAFRYRVQINHVDDYYEPLLAGELQLWIAHDYEIKGAVVTSIDEGSQGKVCNILSLAGKDLKQWIALVDEHICAFARMNGCMAVEAVTRRGFNKYVPDFVEDGIVHVKMLGN